AGAASTGTVIEGNYIGLDAGGAFAIPNAASGVEIEDSPGVVVGGTNAGAGNVISGNILGIYVGGATGTVIQGNLVGTNAPGAAGVGNVSTGVVIGSGSAFTTMGGATPAARNVISANGGGGVQLDGANNVFQGNYVGTDITGNFALGNNGGVAVSG